jgi:hypothetical protein
MTVPAAVSHGSARLGDVTDQWPPELIAKAAGHAQEADRHYAHKERPRSEPWTRVPDEQAARLITAAAPLIAAAERSRLAGHKSREALGRFVREVWVQWASDQADAKPSWLVVWDELEPGQREVDCRIGESVAAVIRAVEETGAQAATRDLRLLVAVLLRQLGHRAVVTDAELMAEGGNVVRSPDDDHAFVLQLVDDPNDPPETIDAIRKRAQHAFNTLAQAVAQLPDDDARAIMGNVSCFEADWWAANSG